MTTTGEGGRRPLSGWKTALGAGLAGALIGGGAVAWTSKVSVRDYLLENPQVIPEAMERLEARKAAEVVGAHRAALETPFAGAWAGAADGDVVLVEFFDYACGYCRKSNEDVDRLLKEDPRLKVVWRDWPVLGPDSEQAARVSLAAAQAGRFRPFYNGLFSLGRPVEATISEAQRAAGIGGPAPSAAADAELSKNHRLAEAIGATGTPTFVVGDRILQGAVGYQALKEAIAEARSKA